jgi:glycosyltransferase involved in cell wall biosynthesis
MNILVVLESFYPNIGGAETLFKAVCEGLAGQGHSVRIVTAGAPDAPASERIRGVDIQRLPIRSRYLFTLCSLVPLWRLTPLCDLVLTTSYNAALPAWMAAVWHGKKIVVVFHEVWGRLWFRLPFFGYLRKTGHYLFEQLLVRLPFDRIVAVSEATRDRLIRHGVPASKVAMIYNGIDYTLLEGYRHAPSAAFTYCYFGRLGISKGLNILLDAAARFAVAYPDSRLKLIVPTSPSFLYDRIRRLIEQHRLERHVALHHSLPQQDLFRELTTSHCVVIPSYAEGFCYAAVEAAGLGVPVISSGQGALPEVVSGAYILLPTLTPDALYDALERARSGRWDRKPPVRFPIEETVAGYHRLMLSMVRPEQTPAAVEG